MTDLDNYLNRQPEEFARKLASMKFGGKEDSLKNQLRKFYDEFKVLERRIKEKEGVDDDTFKAEILPLVHFVKSKVAYSAGRVSQGKPLIPKELKTYLDQRIDEVSDLKSFRHFIMHYQALLSYYVFHREEQDRQNKSKKQGGPGGQGKPKNRR